MNFNKRLDKLRGFMENEKLTSVLLTDPLNQCYMTGFEIITYSRPIFTLITKDECILIVPRLEEEHAKLYAEYDRIFVYYEHPEKADQINPVELIIKCLQDQKGERRLGIESRYLPFELASILQRENWELADITSEMIKMRAIKSEKELEKMRQVCSLAVGSVQAAFRALEVGITELDIEDAAARASYQEASYLYPDSSFISRGMSPSGIERTILPHVFSNLRKVELGDGLIITRITSLDGYKGECERTCFVGEPNAKQRELFEVMVNARKAAFDTIKAGVKANDVDVAARSIIQEAGYGENALHRTGHSIGLAVHEAPFFRFDDNSILKEGMTFTVEPGIYVPGIGGFRHSDTILVTKNGYEMLTECPHSIEELIFNPIAHK
ncbi:M24 family metallopeptidase [Peribacillus frigoritolerans]|uniref:M24 family metallopeptidase n=1 Tax=Peribacillus frigoritolerans TaxID=450367 RepID=UPI0020C0FEAD|nr:Xaa-Pro peptidase family protein [Peribacillus frigoritolerans]MEE3954571.1 Xaa-Pro peptidase family protein [Peribacillus frigoritolerans]